MMLSLPPVVPRIVSAPTLPESSRTKSLAPPTQPHTLSPHAPSSSSSPPHGRQHGYQNPDTNIHQPQSFQTNQTQRSFLSVLRADENAILLRKANIRRFGAGWLRPVGLAKTLQGMDDEKTEREEAEASGRYVSSFFGCCRY